MTDPLTDAMLLGLERTCEDIVAKAGDDLVWEWDERFAAVMCQVKSDDAEAVQTRLETIFASSWTTKTLDSAPDEVKAIADSTGGLREGQILFMADDPLLFAAWWPWGNKSYISIRITYAADKFGGIDEATLNEKLRSWFGL